MRLSSQITCFSQQLEAAQGVVGSRPDLDIGELSNAMRRLAREVDALEQQLDQQNSGLSSEYLSAVLTNARWILAQPSQAPMVRELAEAVLVLAGSANPS